MAKAKTKTSTDRPKARAKKAVKRPRVKVETLPVLPMRDTVLFPFTMASLSPGRDLMGYYSAVQKQVKPESFPNVIENENMLLSILYPLE